MNSATFSKSPSAIQSQVLMAICDSGGFENAYRIADALRVSRATLYRALDRDKKERELKEFEAAQKRKEQTRESK